MIGLKVKVVDETKAVEKAVERAAFKNLGNAAASIRNKAIASIEKSPDPSPPGTPIHTRAGLARKAIRFKVEDPWTAVVGPRASVVGGSMRPHEFGKKYKGVEYPQRPFMGPAMEESVDRFHSSWRGAVHS